MLVNLVNYALSYAAHGFSVIPMGENKKPLIKFANKSPLTADQIKEIWKRHPLANIALKTDKFFVIDVDRHGKEDGMKSIKALNHDEWFKDTLTECTAHNGYHFFFKKPRDFEVTQNIGFLPGVDLKAHVNNYVVVAPSRSKDKAYKWLNKAPIKEPPAGLIELIKSKQTTTIMDYSKMAFKTHNGQSKTAELFEQIVNGFGDTGGRNDSLTKFVGGLLFRGVNPESVAKLALLANENTPDPLDLREVEKTINSMMSKEVARRSAGVE